MSTPRIRRVADRREYDALLDDYYTMGYTILNEGENGALLRKQTWGTAGGHAIWALLTVWWTIGLGNALYAILAHYNAEQVLIKINDANPPRVR